MTRVLTRAMVVPVLALVLFLACREEIASDSDTYARQWEALLRASESPDPTPWQNPGSSKMGSGSYEYARKWKAQLLACQSLDDVKQQFNCIEYVGTGGGGATRFEVTVPVAGRPYALVDRFPDGKWIACAYGDSHSEPGGGTVVSRDSDGAVHVFFGHVCGSLFAEGDTLEEFYRSLTRYNRIEEKPLSLPE